MDRDGISREEVIKRMNRQIDEELKMKLCDFVLVNDEQQLLIPQVLALDEKFRSMTSVPAQQRKLNQRPPFPSYSPLTYISWITTKGLLTEDPLIRIFIKIPNNENQENSYLGKYDQEIQKLSHPLFPGRKPGRYYPGDSGSRIP